ncbi:MAG: acetaldehyde dehydrogenase (acetylating) [Candidatus Falkowbacteria bacterium]
MISQKIKVGIIGTGNIGTDLLYKIQRSELLECSLFAGRDAESQGIKRAEKMGVHTSHQSIDAIKNEPTICDIVFDATSAKAHIQNAKILKELGKFTIDLTPSRIGKMCIPVINVSEALDLDNVNMVTCGGQASVPIAKAIMDCNPETEYIEVVASISSKSAGPGTRLNIDEYTQTTKDAIKVFSGVPSAKAIIILNPAEPPILMNNTIYAKMKEPNLEKIKARVLEIEAEIKQYVPGYKIALGPIYENGRLVVMIEVTGRGDYLPSYSGNLDIITCAAVKVAEEYAKKILKNHE